MITISPNITTKRYYISLWVCSCLVRVSPRRTKWRNRSGFSWHAPPNIYSWCQYSLHHKLQVISSTTIVWQVAQAVFIFGHISWQRHHIIFSHPEILKEFCGHIICATNSVNPCKSLTSLNCLKKYSSELQERLKVASRDMVKLPPLLHYGWTLESSPNCVHSIISPWSACLSTAGRTRREAGPVWKWECQQSHLRRNTIYWQPVETRVSPRVVGWASPLLNGEQLRPIGTIQLLKKVNFPQYRKGFQPWSRSWAPSRCRWQTEAAAISSHCWRTKQPASTWNWFVFTNIIGPIG